MKIAFANDHAALLMREPLLERLRQGGHAVQDLGADSEESVDYPDYARRVGQLVASGQADLGVLVCGTGIGMSIAANKVPGVRAAVCTDEYGARMARAHNNANVLALRGRRMDVEQNVDILETFLSVDFEGDRHQRRLDKIAGMEEELLGR